MKRKFPNDFGGCRVKGKGGLILVHVSGKWVGAGGPGLNVRY